MTRLSKFILSNMMFILIIFCDTTQADLSKWYHQEVLTTLRGDRPLQIDPTRITITNNSRKVFEVSGDTAYVNVAGITVKTHQLKYRLAQAGCIYTTGDVMKCAPDVVDREVRRLIDKGDGEIRKLIEEADKAEQIKKQDDRVSERCKAALRNAKKNDQVFEKLHENSQYKILSNYGWQTIVLPYPATRIRIIEKNLSVGSNKKKCIADYQINALLVFIEKLGITAINSVDEDGFLVFPVAVQSLQIRINDEELSDNEGAITVKFENRSEDINFSCN